MLFENVENFWHILVAFRSATPTQEYGLGNVYDLLRISRSTGSDGPPVLWKSQHLDVFPQNFLAFEFSSCSANQGASRLDVSVVLVITMLVRQFVTD